WWRAASTTGVSSCRWIESPCRRLSGTCSRRFPRATSALISPRPSSAPRHEGFFASEPQAPVAASASLPDAEVRAGRLVTRLPVEGHREIRGDPQGKCRQGLLQGERRRPESKLLRFLLATSDLVRDGGEARRYLGTGFDPEKGQDFGVQVGPARGDGIDD